MPQVLLLKDHHNERCHNSTSHKTTQAKLPCLLSLTSSSIDPKHDKENVQGSEDVEKLEGKVPDQAPCVFLEKVEISRYEDQGVEGLGNEGDALGAFVSMNGVYEDAFREGMGHVGQDTEYLLLTISSCYVAWQMRGEG